MRTVFIIKDNTTSKMLSLYKIASIIGFAILIIGYRIALTTNFLETTHSCNTTRTGTFNVTKEGTRGSATVL